MTLVDVKKSPNKSKKFRAFFSDGTHTDFGFANAEDYTQHHDKERRKRYIQRHLKDLRTNDPQRAGYLSMFILWGSSTNIEDNIKRYKKIFDN
jgi:hypothetical protein